MTIKKLCNVTPDMDSCGGRHPKESLEEVNNKKAPIFYQRTTKGYTPPSKYESTKDALLHCLNVKGKVDLNWILPSHHRNIDSLNGVKGQSPFVWGLPPHPQKTNL